MASHGAAKEIAREHEAKVGKFHHMELHPAANGGAVVHHFHEHSDGLGGFREHGQPYTFSKDGGHELAAHIQEHVGIAMPGKATEPETEPEDEP